MCVCVYVCQCISFNHRLFDTLFNAYLCPTNLIILFNIIVLTWFNIVFVNIIETFSKINLPKTFLEILHALGWQYNVLVIQGTLLLNMFSHIAENV